MVEGDERHFDEGGIEVQVRVTGKGRRNRLEVPRFKTLLNSFINSIFHR